MTRGLVIVESPRTNRNKFIVYLNLINVLFDFTLCSVFFKETNKIHRDGIKLISSITLHCDEAERMCRFEAYVVCNEE